MVDPVTITLLVTLAPILPKIVIQLLQYKQVKISQAAKPAREMEDELERKWKAKLAQYKEDAREREKDAQNKREEEARKEGYQRRVEQERDEKAQLEREKDCEWKRRVQEELEREKSERIHSERKREKESEFLRHAIQQDCEWKRQFHEELEREKSERIHSERKREKESEFLRQTIQQFIKLLFYMLSRRRRPFNNCGNRGCHCCKTWEYLDRPTYEQIFGEEIEDDDVEQLQSLLSTSLPLLKDIPDHLFDGAESSEHPNYGKDFALLKLQEQLPDNFEDEILSSVMTTMTSINYGTQAKEEGNKYFNDKNFIEAIKCYSKSIDESPTAAAYANRAMAYYELNKFNEVEKDCSEALKIDDKYFKAYARRAMARTKLKCNLKGALEDVQFALKLEPNSQKMKELSAQLMCLGGNNKDGIQAKEEGNAYFNDKKFEEAIKCYTKSIEESPTAAAYGNRAISYIKLNKSIEAENDCTEAIKIDDKYFKAYARRAKARNNLGWNLKGAFDDVQVALKLDPNDLEMKELCHELSVQLKFQR